MRIIWLFFGLHLIKFKKKKYTVNERLGCSHWKLLVFIKKCSERSFQFRNITDAKSHATFWKGHIKWCQTLRGNVQNLNEWKEFWIKSSRIRRWWAINNKKGFLGKWVWIRIVMKSRDLKKRKNIQNYSLTCEFIT